MDNVLDQLQSLCGQMGIPLPAPPTAAPAPIVLSFCSGAMGLDLGLEDAGFKVVAVSETDTDAMATIREPSGSARPGRPAGLLRSPGVPAAGIGQADIDLVAAGPPCQSFSLSGKLRGVADERGDVCLRFIDLAMSCIRVCRSGECAGTLGGRLCIQPHSGKFRDDGYVVSYNLYTPLTSVLPQQRERLIIIASRDGRVPYLTPTHSDRPGDGLPPWRTSEMLLGTWRESSIKGRRYSPNRLNSGGC